MSLIDGLAGEDVGEAASDRHDPERDDEGGEVEDTRSAVPEKSPITAPAPTAASDRDGNRALMQRKPEDDAGQADHRAHGKVDAAGQDDEGHADRHDPDHDRLVEQVEEVVRVRK